jgi:hypothetical protein
MAEGKDLDLGSLCHVRFGRAGVGCIIKPKMEGQEVIG